MYDYALINRLPEANIVMEERAGSTVGNAYYVKTSVIQSKRWHNNVVITSNFHIVRAKQVFPKVLGGGYATAYVVSGQELPAIDIITIPPRERPLYPLQKVMFLCIKDGDHEQIKIRFEFLRSPIGTPPRAVKQGALPLRHTWTIMKFSLSDAYLL